MFQRLKVTARLMRLPREERLPMLLLRELGKHSGSNKRRMLTRFGARYGQADSKRVLRNLLDDGLVSEIGHTNALFLTNKGQDLLRERGLALKKEG